MSDPIELNAYDLKVALAHLRPAVAGLGGALPILKSVRMEPLGRGRLKLTASDLELTITATIKCTARKGPAITFPFHQLAETVSAVRKPSKKNPDPTPITLTPGDERTTVEIGARRLSLVPLPVDEFPRCEPTDLTEGPVTVPAEPFAEIAGFTSSDPGRPILTGVLLAEGTMVATDSYRLGARTDLPVIADELIIPASAAKIVGRIGGAPSMTWNGRTVRFAWDDEAVTVTARLIEGQFPNWKGLIPADPPPNRLTFHDLPLTLSALASLARSTNSVVPLKIACDNTGQTVLSVDAHDRLDQFTVPTSYVGEPTKAGYNPKCLASVLRGMDEPTLNIEPQKLSTVSDDKRCRLIMPVRIS